MNFKPQTEKQIAEGRLFQVGTYDFEILHTADKSSMKSGDEMIELKVRVSDQSGVSRIITDYLLAKTPRKLRHAAEVCGVLDKYSMGSLSSVDFSGKRGKLKLEIEKDKTNKYPDKNVVADYIGSTGSRTKAPA